MPIDPRLTRGFLNNNPGNIDRGSVPWNGEIRDVAKCTNDVQRRELTQGRFCVFQNADFGIRAICLNLKAYRDKLGCKSVRDYINRWAPPNENNTEAYIGRVAMEIGVSPGQQIDLMEPRTMKALVRGIIMVECAGMPYQDADLERGMALAGVKAAELPPAPPVEVKKPVSKTVAAGLISAGAGAASVADQIDQVQPVLDQVATAGASMQSILKLGAVALSVVAVVATVYMVIRYIHKRANGEVISQ